MNDLYKKSLSLIEDKFSRIIANLDLDKLIEIREFLKNDLDIDHLEINLYIYLKMLKIFNFRSTVI